MLRKILCILYVVQCFNFYTQSIFTFAGYSAGQTFTTNGYTYTNTQNGTTMSVKVTQSTNPGWFNLTGANSPNYSTTYNPGGCSVLPGLYLATDRTSTAISVSVDMSFAPAVCGPVTFTIADINGANASFRDDVTLTAYDQNGVAIPLTTGMVTNNGAASCAGNPAGYLPVSTVGNSLKVIGCSYDDCYLDYFTIYSNTKMISRITLDYGSGSKDYNNTSISNPSLQYIILSNIRAYTPSLAVSANCAVNPVNLTGAISTVFPPTTSPFGVPAGYPAVSYSPAVTATTYNWTGTAGTITTPNTINTTVSGLTGSGGTFTLTAQNNKGCSTSKSMILTSSSCAVLPAELDYFTGTCQEYMRVLNWSTLTEENTDYFIIEQSTDGIKFAPIQLLDAAGISQMPLRYSCEVAMDKGNYFRLNLVDRNGDIKLLDELYLPNCAGLSSISVSPNPFQDHLVVSNGSSFSTTISYELQQLDGQVVAQAENRFIPENGSLALDCSHLPEGYYVLRISDCLGNVLFTSKYVKLTGIIAQ